ncbi:28S ribosomal protein S36, mitochondrial-like [Asterias rubens]|uniref:28S ribosomal protein S36, mitochondrial-like n=1 Tax=Asterias rubens TaxID=7604 RepID=UPI001455525B|nr:28S ribosomal protein S36, mitochondrial-like [Asterias rubens]
MSAARVVIQRVRPHVPLIKFRFSKATPGPAISSSKAQSNSSTSKVSTRRGEGIDFTSLPTKYKRLPMSIEEMDCINSGGSELY